MLRTKCLEKDKSQSRLRQPWLKTMAKQQLAGEALHVLMVSMHKLQTEVAFGIEIVFVVVEIK